MKTSQDSSTLPNSYDASLATSDDDDVHVIRKRKIGKLHRTPSTCSSSMTNSQLSESSTKKSTTNTSDEFVLSKLSSRKPSRKSCPTEIIDLSSAEPSDVVKSGPKRKLEPSFENLFPKPKSPSSDLWCNRFAPKTSSQVACSKRKIEEISQWITNAISGSMLLLWGSVGCGKSTLINLLLSEMRITKIPYEIDDDQEKLSVIYPQLMVNNPHRPSMIVCEAVFTSNLLSRHYHHPIIFISSTTNQPVSRHLSLTIIHYPNPTANCINLALSSISSQAHATGVSGGSHMSSSSSCDIRHLVQSLSMSTATSQSTTSTSTSYHHSLARIMIGKHYAHPESLLEPCLVDDNYSTLVNSIRCNLIHYHSSNLSVLNAVLNDLSCVEVYVARMYDNHSIRDHSDPVYPIQYMASITARSIAARIISDVSNDADHKFKSIKGRDDSNIRVTQSLVRSALVSDEIECGEYLKFALNHCDMESFEWDRRRKFVERMNMHVDSGVEDEIEE